MNTLLFVQLVTLALLFVLLFLRMKKDPKTVQRRKHRAQYDAETAVLWRRLKSISLSNPELIDRLMRDEREKHPDRRESDHVRAVVAHWENNLQRD